MVTETHFATPSIVLHFQQFTLDFEDNVNKGRAKLILTPRICGELLSEEV